MWIIGFILALTGAIATNLGMNLQKYSSQPPNRRWIFWVGFLLILITQIFDAIALVFISQSVVGALNAFGIGTNLIWNYVYFQLKPNLTQILGLMIVIIANILIIFNSDTTHHTYNVGDILGLIQSKSFCVYLMVIILLFVGIYYIRNHQNSYVQLIRTVSIPGLLAGQTVLFVKIITHLMSTSIEANNQFIYPFTYILIMCLVLFIWIQQITYNQMIGNPAIDPNSISIYSCIFIMTTIFSSFCVFQEYLFISIISSLSICLCLILIIIGITMITNLQIKTDRPTTTYIEPIQTLTTYIESVDDDLNHHQLEQNDEIKLEIEME